MKKLGFLSVLFFSFAQAQFSVDETDNTDTLMEVGKSNLFFNLKKPFEHYKIDCPTVLYAKLLDNEEKFKKDLEKNLRIYLDNYAYSVDGTFNFIFEVNEQGQLSKFSLTPKVNNSEMLYSDLEFIFRKMAPKWQPASCDGIPIPSKIRLKVTFRSEEVDI